MPSKSIPQLDTDGDKRSRHGNSRIIDIRREQRDESLSKLIRTSLKGSKNAGPSFPAMLLWNEKGLRLFEAITYLEDYYLARDEIEILEQRSHEIAQKIKPNSMVIELGSGNPRKINFLLEALENRGQMVDYFALDLSLPELERTIRMLSSNAFKHVRYHGLLGTFDDAHAWLQLPENLHRPKCVITLGSSLGNFSRPEALDFLSGFAKILRHDGQRVKDGQRYSAAADSSIIIGLDSCKSGDRIRRAYCDPYGLNAQFMLNALDNANTVLGYEAFKMKDWTVRGLWDDQTECHDQYLVPLENQMFEGICLKAGEMVHITSSYKYDDGQKAQLWKKAGLREVDGWRTNKGCTEIDKPISMLVVDQ